MPKETQVPKQGGQETNTQLTLVKRAPHKLYHLDLFHSIYTAPSNRVIVAGEVSQVAVRHSKANDNDSGGTGRAPILISVSK